MTIREERANVSRIALEWELTPYIHEGRIKKKCADCTFFAKVFEEAGLWPPLSIPHYGAHAHLNRESSIYLPTVLRLAKREIEEKDARVGDVVLYFIARNWSHGALIIEPGWPNVIHANARTRTVTRDWGNNGYLMHFRRRFFSVWDANE
jgi:hypothetical protein